MKTSSSSSLDELIDLKQGNPLAERIFEKLKAIKANEKIKSDPLLSSDVDFIIQGLTSLNIFSLEQINVLPKMVSEFSNPALRRARDLRTLKITKKLSIKNYSENLNIVTPRFLEVNPENLEKLSKQIALLNTINFNIFEVNDVVHTSTMLHVAKEVFVKFKVNQDKFDNFIKTISGGYNRSTSPYHNDLHATDVFQTLFVIINQGNLINYLELNELDEFAIYISALCHDFRHPGTNNDFHIKTKSDIALTYNDISVLENYHVSQTFKALNDENNILSDLTPAEYRTVRRRMIKGILATDMFSHGKMLLQMKNKKELYNIHNRENIKHLIEVGEVNDPLGKKFELQQDVLNFFLHSCDISNSCKPQEICKEWASRVYDEFFAQGDKEREMGIEIAPLCDRRTTTIGKAMLGFLDFIIIPTFSVLEDMFGHFGFKENYVANRKYYEEEAKKEKEAKKREEKKGK